MTTQRGHRQVEHTADLALELWAPTEPALWEEAALALIEILTGGAAVAPSAEREVRLNTIDREDRLVQWMNEVLYWATVEGFLVTGAALRTDGEALVGRAAGHAGGQHLLEAELKSATYHDLEVIRADGLWRARVVVDV